MEITDKALKVLKIEAALSGLPQKEALEALILRGASAQSVESADLLYRTDMFNAVYRAVVRDLIQKNKDVGPEEINAALIERGIVDNRGAVNWTLILGVEDQDS